MDKMESKSRRIQKIIGRVITFSFLIMLSCKLSYKENQRVKEQIKIEWYYPNNDRNFSVNYSFKMKQIDSLNYHLIYSSENDTICNKYFINLNKEYSQMILKNDTSQIRLYWMKEYYIEGVTYPIYNFKLFDNSDDGIINMYWNQKLGVIRYYNRSENIVGKVNYINNIEFQSLAGQLTNLLEKDTLFYKYDGHIPPLPN